MKNFIWIVILFSMTACFSGKNETSKNKLTHSLPTDTALARRYLQEATVLLDSVLLDSAFAKAKTSRDINARYSVKLDLDIASLFEDIGLAAYGNRDIGLMIATFQAALGVYKQAGEYKTIRVARLNNNLGIALRSTWQLKDALFHFNECLKIRLELQGENNEDVAKTYNNIGVVLSDIGKNREALDNYEKALRIKRLQSDRDTLSIANTYMNIGGIYGELKNSVRAMEQFDRTQEILKTIKGTDTRELWGKLYNNIANVYIYRKDYYTSLRYIQQAITTKIAKYGDRDIEVARSYANLASVYMEMKQYDAALTWYQRALDICLEKEDIGSVDAGLAYIGISNLYGATERFDEAVENMDKGLEMIIPSYTESHTYIGECYSNLGSIYMQQSEFDKALSYFNKALQIFTAATFDGDMSFDMARTCINIGLAYKHAGRATEALESFNRVLRLDTTGKLVNPELKFSLFEASLFKAELLSNMVQTSQDALNAMQVFEQALALGEDFRDDLEEHYSKVKFLSLINQVAEGLILLQVNGPAASEETKRRAFTIAEKSKAFLLHESIRQSHALAFSNLPDSLRNKETDLRRDIEYYEKQYYLETSVSESDDSLIKFYNSKLIGLKRAYKDLKDYLEYYHRPYYELRYARTTETVEALQQSVLLQPGQCLLEYFVGQKSIFAFLVKKDAYEVQEIKKDFAMEAWIEQFRQGLYGFHTAEVKTDSLKRTTQTQYAAAAFHLYEKLISPFEDRLDSNLIIIPDGDMGYLPFEALLTQNPDKITRYQSHQYLLLKHRISYAYSTGLLRKMKEKSNLAEVAILKPFLGFAPYYYGSGSVSNGAHTKSLPNRTLLHSGEEVAALQKQFGGHAYYGVAASKALFLSLAAQYRIIHLATHGVANYASGEYSAIAFGLLNGGTEEDLLYVKDFFNIVLNAELVTLSACETGIGELQPGEGVISLSRAFAYAGAKSIVSSLWQVKDERTKTLMLLFYEHLEKGKSKDEALWAAKNDFLSQGKEDEVHPYYWSGFIAIGNMDAIFK